MGLYKTEAEFAADLVTYLEQQGFEVFKEVNCGSGHADLVVRFGYVTWAIETKLSLTLDLLCQAYNRRREFWFTSIATPSRERFDAHWILTDFMRENGIGWLAGGKSRYSDGLHFRENMAPRINRALEARRAFAKYGRKGVRFHELQKGLIAGARSGGQKSGFQLTNHDIVEFIRKHGPQKPKDIAEGVAHHYTTPKAFLAGIMRALYGRYLDGVELRDGLVHLKEEAIDGAAN